MEIRRPSAEWVKIVGVSILDPDGWDRTNFVKSWDELITEEEFRNRASVSTVYWGRR